MSLRVGGYGLAVLALGVGCTYGAGAFAGYGDHGFVYGGEGNAGGSVRGALGVEGAVGIQNDGFVYGRADLAGLPRDAPLDTSPDWYAWGGRVGVGGGQRHGEWSGIASAGATAAVFFGSRAGTPIENAYCDADLHAIETSIELRYAEGGFQLVVASRYQFYAGFCHN